MLGLPLIEWMRFFACSFVAGFLLFLIPYGPMSIVAIFEMVAAAAGLLVVAIYTKSYEPWAWRRLLVRARRFRRFRPALARMLRPRVAVRAETVPVLSVERQVVIPSRRCKAFTRDEECALVKSLIR